jgi:hypothetical protein
MEIPEQFSVDRRVPEVAQDLAQDLAIRLLASALRIDRVVDRMRSTADEEDVLTELTQVRQILLLQANELLMLTTWSGAGG